jgi:hypothetical protein
MSSPSFFPTPATASGLPTLAQISQEAFSIDTHTRLKDITKITNHVLEMTSVLSSWLSRPRKM